MLTARALGLGDSPEAQADLAVARFEAMHVESGVRTVYLSKARAGEPSLRELIEAGLDELGMTADNVLA